MRLCLEQLTSRLSTSDWLAYDPGRGVLSRDDLLKWYSLSRLKLWNMVQYSENKPTWS